MTKTKPTYFVLFASYLMMAGGLFFLSAGLLDRPRALFISSELGVFIGLSIVCGGLFSFVKHYAYPACKLNDNPLVVYLFYFIAWAVWPWMMLVNSSNFHKWTLVFVGGMFICTFFIHWVMKKSV